MSKRNYTASQRGKLVKVADKDGLLVYLGMSPAKKSAEYVTGPTTVGTATGYTYTEGSMTFQEVLRTAKNPFFATVETIYLDAAAIELADNPNYDPSKDTDRPKEEATTSPVSGDDIGDTSPDVTSTPGAGRVPVTATDGKTVYVLVKEPAATTTAQSVMAVATGSDPNRKWLTYGLYGVLALAAISLIVIVTRKPKPQQKLLPA